MKYIASWSGGKDSSFMILKLIELKYPLDRIIMCDTGLEFKQMYAYIDKFIQEVITPSGVPLTILNKGTGRHTFAKWMFGKFTRGKNSGRVRGWPFTIGMSYCTRELKVQPLRPFQNKDTKWYIGIGADEHKRLKNDDSLIYPLALEGITEQMCLDGLKRAGLHNPLYDVFDRTGCFLCPKQKLESFRKVFMHYPEEWKTMKVVQRRLIELDAVNTQIIPGYTVFDLEDKFNLED